jgi:hypothetical protein
VQSSNLASHIVRTLVQTATGTAMSGALATPSTKVIMLMAANTNVTGFADLFHLDWILPGYQADTAAPGGALVCRSAHQLRFSLFLRRVIECPSPDGRRAAAAIQRHRDSRTDLRRAMASSRIGRSEAKQIRT